jgi:iron complex outermembrane receptor protein
MASSSVRLRRSLIVSTFLAASGAVFLQSPAHAQAAASAAAAAPAAPAAVEEIVVTAERRSTDLQKAALSVTAVSSQRLDQSFVNNLAGLNATVPSLEITKASGFENLVTIRGVGSETPENATTTVPGVSMFIDGVYIANTVALDQTLFDINNIQVLRGPQGSLYGESSIGGAIIVETQQPKLNTFDGKADASFGNYNLFRERAEVNIPLGDDFALRVSGQKFDHDGFTKDAALNGYGLDDAHDASGKVALTWKPNDHFTATLTAQGYYADQHGDAQKNTNLLYDPASPTLTTFQDFEPSTDPRVVNQDYPAHFMLATQLYHLNLEYDTPWFAIKTVTAYQDLNHVQRMDDTRSTFENDGSWASPYTLPPYYNNSGFVYVPGLYNDVAAWNTHVRNFSQEVDIQSLPGSALEWDVGAFYMQEQTHQFVAEFEGTTAPTAADLAVPADYVTDSAPFTGCNYSAYNLGGLKCGNPPANTEYGNDSLATHDSYAFFGQVGYHFTPNFRVTLGVRLNYDDTADPSLTMIGANFEGGTPSITSSDYHSRNVVPTWRGEADYDLTNNNMLYASIARGYKPGGVNGKSGFITLPAVFQPETNDAYEVGTKNYFFDRSLRLNAAAFYYVHHDFQYIEADPASVGGIANVPSIHDYGVEFEGAYVALDGKLHVDANLSIENGEVTSNYYSLDTAVANYVYRTNTNCAYSGQYYDHACWAAVVASEYNLKGKTPPAMPKYAGSIAVSYRFDVPTGSVTPRVEVVYRGAEWARIFDLGAIDYLPAYTQTNLNIEYVPQGSKFRVSLAATNLFNVDGVNAKYTNPYGVGQTSEQYIAPRQVIGTIAYAF